MTYFDEYMNRTITGTVTSSDAAEYVPQSVWNWPTNVLRPSDQVITSGDFRMTLATIHSAQADWKLNRKTVISAGVEIGMISRKNASIREQPSTRPASSRSIGIVS